MKRLLLAAALLVGACGGEAGVGAPEGEGAPDVAAAPDAGEDAAPEVDVDAGPRPGCCDAGCASVEVEKRCI